MKKIHFIHTADLHLDSPFLNLKHLPKDLFEKIQESTFKAFENVIDAAVEKDVDFVLIVGDLYDGEDRSIKAQARLKAQMERLQRANINAFIIHGNHDHLSGNWITLDLPENVYIFNDQVEMVPFVTKENCVVHLYGFSYPNRHVAERKVKDYQKIGEADFHIGLLHGFYDGSSSQHYKYAPFTKEELLQKKMDYWALGHIHKRQILHNHDPYIVYPGNIQGRNRNEQGIKGCYSVALSTSTTNQIEFIPTSVIEWKTLEMDCHGVMELTDLYSKYIREISSIAETTDQSVMLDIHLKKINHLSNEVKQKITNGELQELLQDDIDFNDHFIWPYNIRLDEERLEQSDILDESFMDLLSGTLKEMEYDGLFEQVVSELFSHTYGSRYVSQIDDQEKKELLQTAKHFMIEKLDS